MGENAIGRQRWAIPDGYIPAWSHGPDPEMTSHEGLSILNTGDREVEVRITLYFTDREPAGPYRVRVGARRTNHVRMNLLTDPEPVPLGTPYASVVEADAPVVVQITRLDSRQAENALLSTIAFPV
ncbi:sensory rhodopsin transducer [Azospirillum oleiclasticum]|uniref:sensory rhodopsin transducer n=1 Tax=Azospirillum oleiclasticum TaxID=2735135 RepID=UPI001FEB5376|nr:sensory rhodopsin transducer [Azospirillum oleiclasticum]